MGAAGGAINAYFQVAPILHHAEESRERHQLDQLDTRLVNASFCSDGAILHVKITNGPRTELDATNATILVDGVPVSGFTAGVDGYGNSSFVPAGYNATFNKSGYASTPGHVAITTASGVAFAAAAVDCPVLTTIVLSPSSASMAIGATQDFLAIGYDQYGALFDGSPYAFASDCGSLATINTTATRLTAGTTAGACHVNATSGTIAGSASVTIRPDPVASVSVAPTPVGVPAGGSQAFTATMLDQYSNVNTTATIAWSTNAGSISNAGVLTAQTTAASGKQVTATANGHAGSASVTVYAAAPSAVAVSPDGAGVTAGSTRSYSATVTDTYGNVNSTAPIAWSTNAGSIDSAGLLTAQTTAASGKSVTATTTGAVSGSATVDIIADAPSTIAVSPDGAGIPAGSTQQYTAIVSDQYGNVNGTAPVVWTTNGGSISGAGLLTAQTTAASGKTVTATSGGVSRAATVDIIAAAPSTLAVSPSGAGVPAGGTQAYTATVRDQYGNVNSTAPVTWSTNAGSISNVGVLTAQTTAASGKTVTATTGALSTPVTVDIISATPSTLTVTPSGAGVTAGSTQAYTAVIKDQYGNVNNTATVTWSTNAGSISSGGVLTAQTTAASGKTVTATGGGLTTPVTVDIIAAAPSTVTVTPSGAGVTAGGTQAYSAVVRDTYGNINSTATVTWSTNGGSISSGGVLTAQTTAASGKSVTATASGVQGSVTVDIIAAAPSTVTVSPNGAGVTAGGSQAYSAVVRDTYGNVNSTATVTWSTNGGSITSGGVLTAQTTAASGKSVTATASGVQGSATVDIIAAAPATLTVAPTPVGVAAGGSQAFTATVLDTYGNANTTATVTWSTNAGTITSGGVLTAQTTAASGKSVTGTTTGAVSGSASVTVYAAAPASVAISPTSGNINTQTTQQFTATATDAYGNVNSTATIAWSATRGSVDSSGLYTAPSTTGADTVTATTNGHSSSASMTVIKTIHITTMVTYLNNVSTSTFSRGANDHVEVRTTIVDHLGNAVSGVSVTLQWLKPDTTVDHTDTLTSAADGTARGFYTLPNGATKGSWQGHVSAMSGTNMVRGTDTVTSVSFTVGN